MADGPNGEKTEEPTSKRLNELREEGNFAKVPEVSAAVVLLVAFIVWRWQGSDLAREFMNFSREWFRELNVDLIHTGGIVGSLRELIMALSLTLGVLFALLAGATIAANGMQTSLKLSPKALGWKWNKLDPLKGTQNMFSKSKLTQLVIEVTKFSCIGVVLGMLIWNLRTDPIFTRLMPLSYLMGFMMKATTQLSLGLLFTLIVIAAAHYFWNRRNKMDEWKMTKQEVRDEMRQQEGDPMVKRARHQASMRLRQRRMMEQIPLADVVVTNPTHYAIVLKYDPDFEDAPRVIAKGARSRAQHLKRLAAKHGIPMIENRPVARGLYRRAQVGQLIPADFFPAVAGILSFVFKHYKFHCHTVKRRRAAARAKETLA